MKNIAVLLTCHNRVEKTLKCLRGLMGAEKPADCEFSVFLVDDGSTDGTGVQVKEEFPEVNVILGDGNLFWCGGMRLAWKTALEYSKRFDFFLWLNDDTFLNRDGLLVLFEDYQYLFDHSISALIIGAFEDPVSGELTYSGRRNGVKVVPSGKPAICDYVTGNFVLIPRIVFEAIGMLSHKYSHGIGDNDYGYRAQELGYSCYVVSRIVGTCKLNDKIKWFDPRLDLLQRLKALFSKTGGNFWEYLYYVKEHRGYIAALGSFAKSCLRLLFPRVFIK